MNTRWHLQLIQHFHVKSVGLLWRISLGAVGLFDGDDGYLFAQDFERNLFYKETHGFRSAAQCIPDQKAYGDWQKYFAKTCPHTKTSGVTTVVHVVSGSGHYVEPGITRPVQIDRQVRIGLIVIPKAF